MPVRLWPQDMSRYWAKIKVFAIACFAQLAIATSGLLAASIFLVLLGIAAYLSRRSGWTTVCAKVIEHVGWNKPSNNFVEDVWG